MKGDTPKSGTQGLGLPGWEWEERAVLHSSSPHVWAGVLAEAGPDTRVTWDQADTALEWLRT